MTIPSDILRATDVFLECSRRPLIVILGPTASGKTPFSIDLAQHIGGEIINADSRQLYRGLDIGTAKITEEEMRGVPHHMIDVLDPNEEAAVGWYQEQAMNVIADVHGRGKTPLLVGGSMLYVSAITDGLTFGPKVSSAVRDRLTEEYERDGGVVLYKRLQTIDPDAAAGTHPNNKPRIIRALEIYEVLHAPKSKTVSSKGELRPRGERSHNARFNLLIFGIDRSSDVLKKRIAERTADMISRGWIGEVRNLLAEGYTENDPGMKSVGYREIVQYIKESESLGSDTDLDAMQGALTQRITVKARRYAKRQLTWWRGDARIHWIHL